MSEDTQVAGIIMPDEHDDEVAGIIIQEAHGDDEPADASLG